MMFDPTKHGGGCWPTSDFKAPSSAAVNRPAGIPSTATPRAMMVLARITSVELAESPRVRYRGLSANSTLWVMSGTALTFVPANQRWTSHHVRTIPVGALPQKLYAAFDGGWRGGPERRGFRGPRPASKQASNFAIFDENDPIFMNFLSFIQHISVKTNTAYDDYYT